MNRIAFSIALTSLALTFAGCEQAGEWAGELTGEDVARGAEEQTQGEHGGHDGEEGHGGGGHGHPVHKILVTSPVVKDVVSTQQYVCQIHSRRHIEVRALEGGYLEAIKIDEGQAVEEGQTLFEILPTLYKARLDSDVAEAQVAQVEYDNTKKLVEQNIVSPQELKMVQAKLAKAEAKVRLARAELDFANLKAPFAGIVDRQLAQEGSLLEEGDVLTTLSDNSVMWAYFNVPEARYLEYKAELDAAADEPSDDDGDDDGDDDDGHDDDGHDDDGHDDDGHDDDGHDDDGHDDDGHDDDGDDDDGHDDDGDDDDRHDDDDDDDAYGPALRVELVLANGKTFPQPGVIGAIEADFNNETGNIAFRADFPNPRGLLRNGQTGTILIHRDLKNAIVIPQRATYEILAKRYVYVVGEDGVVRQRDITVSKEFEDLFVIESGVDAGDRIVLEGIRQVRDGDQVDYEYRDPSEVLANLKYHAE